MRSRPTNATPSPQAVSRRCARGRSGTTAAPGRFERPRPAPRRSAPSVASRVPSALNRVSQDAAPMGAQEVNFAAGGGVPEPRGAVGASGGDAPSVRADADREHLSFVSRPASRASRAFSHRECSRSCRRGLRPRPGVRWGRRRRRVRCRSVARSERSSARARWRARRGGPARPQEAWSHRAAGSSRRLRSRAGCSAPDPPGDSPRADAATWRAVARRASSRASLRRTSANAARIEAAAASTANPATVARRRRARRRTVASAAARASARYSRSPAVSARSVAPAHASNCASRPSRGRYSGSRPVSCHSRPPRRAAGGGGGRPVAPRSTREAAPIGTGSPRARPRRSASATAARDRR